LVVILVAVFGSSIGKSICFSIGSSTTTTMSDYNPCPIGGLVCLPCNYSLQTYDGYIKEIAKHERNNENHPVKREYPERLTLTRALQKYNDDLAERIVTALPNQVMARDIILAEINPMSTFKYCTECSLIVYDVKFHKSKSHMKWCKDDCDGYASKYWTKKNPRVLPSTFTMNDISLLSASLQESILSIHPGGPKKDSVVKLHNRGPKKDFVCRRQPVQGPKRDQD
jgi:hypothetical protein